MIRPAGLLAALLTIALVGCAGDGASPSTGAGRELVVYAAASLTGVMTDIAAAYEAASPASSIVLSSDSSAALETKIEQGAPADVFLSADTASPQALIDRGLAAGDMVVFAVNELAVIVPADNPAGLVSPADLARPGVKVIAAGEAVPITRYAVRLVANLAAEPGYPSDFEAAYTANVVTREDNVSGVVAKVALGEGDAGIVYRTDARGSDRVKTIEVPPGANVPATYGSVVVRASARRVAAAAFLAWLAGPDGQGILAAHGFRPVDG